MRELQNEKNGTYYARLIRRLLNHEQNALEELKELAAHSNDWRTALEEIEGYYATQELEDELNASIDDYEGEDLPF